MELAKSKAERRNLTRIFLWILLVCGLVLFLVYGFSMLLAKPKVETITTSPTPFNSNKRPMENIKYHSSQKKH